MTKIWKIVDYFIVTYMLSGIDTNFRIDPCQNSFGSEQYSLPPPLASNALPLPPSILCNCPIPFFPCWLLHTCYKRATVHLLSLFTIPIPTINPLIQSSPCQVRAHSPSSPFPPACIRAFPVSCVVDPDPEHFWAEKFRIQNKFLPDPDLYPKSDPSFWLKNVLVIHVSFFYIHTALPYSKVLLQPYKSLFTCLVLAALPKLETALGWFARSDQDSG